MPANSRKFSFAVLPVVAAAISAGTLVSAPSATAGTATATVTAQTATFVPLSVQPRVTIRKRAPKPPPVLSQIDSVLNIVRAQQGDPYVYGAAGPNAFDCSGLVYYATHLAGFTGVPRTSSAQAAYMRQIPRSEMRPGDFVFFGSGGGVYHVGVYLGDNTILHAPFPGASVRVERIWTDSWFGGTLR